MQILAVQVRTLFIQGGLRTTFLGMPTFMILILNDFGFPKMKVSVIFCDVRLQKSELQRDGWRCQDYLCEQELI